MKETKEEAAIEVSGTPQMFITQAIKQGLSVDHLDKLLTLQQRWNADKAREAFYMSFNIFQSSVPIIEKKKKVSFNTTNYKYADLAEISETIKETAKECGFSYRWKFSEEGTKITCTCIVSHVLGHSEESSMIAEKDTSGNKNSIQAIGSARTYLQRYTLIAGLGLTTADEDVDGRTESVNHSSVQSSRTPSNVNTNTGEVHPEPQQVTSNGKEVSFKVFDPKIEQITFGKYSGMEWITLDRGYLEWIVKNGQPDSKRKAEATLKYLENGESQQPVIDDLAEVFDKKPETLTINDTEKKTKAITAIGKATSNAKCDAIIKTAAGYLNSG